MVSLSIGCTGTLIDHDTVLTAKHCTLYLTPDEITVGFHHIDNDGTPDVTVGVSAITHVSDTMNTLDGEDVSLLTLSAPAPVGITPVRLWDGDATGMVADTAGFGFNGVGSAGHGDTGDGLRWAGRNVIDLIGAALDEQGNPLPGSSNILNTDFDDGSAINNILGVVGSSALPLPLEATTAFGDSGGPLIVDINGEGLIVGVLSSGTTDDSVYGDVSWWTGTGPFRPQIEAAGGQFVPEPTALTAMAIVAMGLTARRRERSWIIAP